MGREMNYDRPVPIAEGIWWCGLPIVLTRELLKKLVENRNQIKMLLKPYVKRSVNRICGFLRISDGLTLLLIGF